jgi:signal peptidase I
LRSSENRPSLRVRAGRELPLSGEALLGLLSEVLAKGVRFRFRASGYSMSPFIRDGDVITVRPCKRTDLRKGAVAAYLRPLDGHLAVHRIVGGTETGFALKGDHEPISDYPVAASGIMGVVDRVERNGRRVRLGLGPEKGFIAVLSARGLITLAFRTFGRNRGSVS